MTVSLLHAWHAARLSLAQTPVSQHGSHRLGITALILLFLLLMGTLVFELVKRSARGEARHTAKSFLVLPLMLAGILFLSWGGMLVVYRFSWSGPRPSEAPTAAEPTLAAEAAFQAPAIALSPSPLSQNASGQAAGEMPSAATRFFRALNKAFANAVQSTFVRDVPAVAAAPSGSRSGLSGSLESAKRPAWVDAPPSTTADSHEVVVKAGPWKTPIECEQSLDEEIAAAVERFVAWRIGEDAREQVSLPAEYARTHLVKDHWLERIDTSLGEMYNLHALLAFDRQVEGKLRDAWNETVAGARLVLAAVVFAGVILLLSLIYGYLRVDQATGGAHRRRLRLAAAGILALVAAGAVYVLS